MKYCDGEKIAESNLTLFFGVSGRANMAIMSQSASLITFRADVPTGSRFAPNKVAEFSGHTSPVVGRKGCARAFN